MGNCQSGGPNAHDDPASKADLLLSSDEMELLRETWREAKSLGSNEPGTTIFQNISKFSPEIGDLFETGDPEGTRLDIHAKMLTKTLDKLIKNLDAYHICDAKIKSLGKEHVGVNEEVFKLEMWETFAQSMLDCVVDWGDKGQEPETAKAWKKVVTYFLLKMREGYDESSRKKHKENRE